MIGGVVRGALWVKFGLPAVLIGLVVAAAGLMMVGAASTTAQAAAGCGVQTGVGFTGDVDAALLPYPVIAVQSSIAVTPEQTANVAVIVSVVKARGLPLRAAVIAVGTAVQESVLRNIDYGDRDSLGLFQQRPSQGWGTPEQILDPVYSTGKFLNGLVGVPGWETMELTVAAQAVQRSGFPDAYAKWELLAAQLVTAAGDTPALDPSELDTGAGVDPAVPVPSACGLVGGAAGAEGPIIPAGLVTVTAFPAESATLDDPTTTGRITPRTLALIQATQGQGYAGGGITCWDAHAWNPTSDHPLGRACDVFSNHLDPVSVAQGWAYANYLVANQAALGIKYLIWQGLFWEAANPDSWGPYSSDIYGCPNPAEISGCHYDHVHVSVY